MRVGEQIVAGPPDAVRRSRRRRQRNVDVAELFVRRHRIPRAEIAGDLPGLVPPGVVAEFPRARHDVERPEQLAALRIEASDILGRRFLLERAGVARSSRVPGDDDDIADHEGAGAVVEARRQRLILLEVQARAPLVAEAGHRFAGAGHRAHTDTRRESRRSACRRCRRRRASSPRRGWPTRSPRPASAQRAPVPTPSCRSRHRWRPPGRGRSGCRACRR